MDEWKDCKLADVIKFGNGKERPKTEGRIPVYGGNGILGHCDTFNYKDETIIVGRVGAYCGTVFYNNGPIWVSDNALAAKPKNNFHAKFLYYFLKNLELNNYAEGSSHPLVTQTLLNSIDVSIPNKYVEQLKISSILSGLDDKIDLLHRQNRTLELLAETLFKKMVISKSESWKLGVFGDLITTTIGGEWGKENPEGDFTFQVCCIRGTDIADLQTGLSTRAPVRFVKEMKFKNITPGNGDLIMEISGGTDNQATGRTTYINDQNRLLFPHPLIFSNFCRLIRPKRKEYSYFLYLYIKFLYDQGDFFNLENGSSGIKNLDYKSLLFELKFLLPMDENEILRFNEKIEIYFENINRNKYQIRTLTQLRDILLPKLMSGEVRI